MRFDHHIGIDYSGRETPVSRTSALQVYADFSGNTPRRIAPPETQGKARKNWCRKGIASWLLEQTRNDPTFIVGIDHGFSFPLSYFERYQLNSWPAFLDDFVHHWPTDEDHTKIDSIRAATPHQLARTGSSRDLRLTEKWSSSAKSVFQFDVQGSVAKSTHAGLPWLRQLRHEAEATIHFWPFDGWTIPEGKSVVAEIYPSIFSKRYDKGERTPDQQDAYSVARWLAEADARSVLDRYFAPPLTPQERRFADLEGWILGIL
ncbi:MAG: hypothetical protein GY768_12115 [Planctomycetaceae bacterium]|nr:hypothetical protein [Planctomycetaceae bacterium]